MEAVGYILAIIVAAALAAGAYQLAYKRIETGWNMLAFFGLAFLGTWGGARLFGGIGDIESISQTGPSIGGFYILTGLIGGLVMMAAVVYGARRAEKQSTDIADQGIRDPKIAHLLFNDTRSAALWLGVRVYIGFLWLSSGWGKYTGDGWMDGGSALQGYWARVTVVPDEGRPIITYGWYRDFLTYMLDNGWYSWFAKVVVFGEILVGVGLIVGALVGISAFFGTVLNFNFMLAGTASTNPVMFGLSVFLILAWKVAGHFGVDRVLLPALGAPWSPGKVFVKDRDSQVTPTTT
jgi:thiosulfate dehydrogenase (quinone) large subunit